MSFQIFSYNLILGKLYLFIRKFVHLNLENIKILLNSNLLYIYIYIRLILSTQIDKIAKFVVNKWCVKVALIFTTLDKWYIKTVNCRLYIYKETLIINLIQINWTCYLFNFDYSYLPFFFCETTLLVPEVYPMSTVSPSSFK